MFRVVNHFGSFCFGVSLVSRIVINKQFEFLEYVIVYADLQSNKIYLLLLLDRCACVVCGCLWAFCDVVLI